MTEQETLKRTLELMMLLGKGQLKIAQIARKLSITERTAYRYLETLRECGFVVEKDKGCFYIAKSPQEFREISDLLYFSREEQYLLYSAIESLEDDLPLKQDLKRKLYSIYDGKVVPKPTLDPQQRDNFQLLVAAIKEKKQVLLKDYCSSHSGNISDRLLEPFRFTASNREVVCYEIASRKVKNFKLPRIGKVLVLAESWKFETLHREDAIDIFHISGAQTQKLSLKLSLRAANLLKEEFPLSKPFLRPLADGRWQLKTEICGFQGVGRFILGLYPEIEIQTPKELKAYIAQQLQNYSEAANR